MDIPSDQRTETLVPGTFEINPFHYLHRNYCIMITFLLWCILFILSAPLAILALILYPIIWLLLLPFRLVGAAVDGILILIWSIVTFPVRIFSSKRR